MVGPVRKDPEVFFSPAQLEYLNNMFRPVVMPPEATEAAMRYYFGQQSVLFAIKHRVRGASPAIVQENPCDIPAPR